MIDREEYISVMSVYGVSKSDAESAFSKFAVVSVLKILKDTVICGQLLADLAIVKVLEHF